MRKKTFIVVMAICICAIFAIMTTVSAGGYTKFIRLMDPSIGIDQVSDGPYPYSVIDADSFVKDGSKAIKYKEIDTAYPHYVRITPEPFNWLEANVKLFRVYIKNYDDIEAGLEILFDSKVFDPAYIMGEFWFMWVENIYMGRTDFVSTYERREAAAMRALQRQIDALLAIE